MFTYPDLLLDNMAEIFSTMKKVCPDVTHPIPPLENAHVC